MIGWRALQLRVTIHNNTMQFVSGGIFATFLGNNTIRKMYITNFIILESNITCQTFRLRQIKRAKFSVTREPAVVTFALTLLF